VIDLTERMKNSISWQEYFFLLRAIFFQAAKRCPVSFNKTLSSVDY